MATEASLRPGGTYFLLTFEDPSFRRPLIATYEYLGKNLDSSIDKSGESNYYFRIVDSDGDQLMLRESQIWQALNVNELIQRLADFRDGKIK